MFLFDNIVIMNSIYLGIHETYYRQHTLQAVSHFVEEEEEEEEEDNNREKALPCPLPNKHLSTYLNLRIWHLHTYNNK